MDMGPPPQRPQLRHPTAVPTPVLLLRVPAQYPRHRRHTDRHGRQHGLVSRTRPARPRSRGQAASWRVSRRILVHGGGKGPICLRMPGRRLRRSGGSQWISAIRTGWRLPRAPPGGCWRTASRVLG